MARYDKTIDLLLVYIENPAASYILSFVLSFISTMRDSFRSDNTMITLLLLFSVLSFRALISSLHTTFFNSSIIRMIWLSTGVSILSLTLFFEYSSFRSCIDIPARTFRRNALTVGNAINNSSLAEIEIS